MFFREDAINDHQKHTSITSGNLRRVGRGHFLGVVFARVLISKKPLPGLLAGPGRLPRFILVLLTFGLLVGCANSDPLAVASGPLFPLNSGHWQPTPQDLAAPPSVVDR